MFIKFPKTVSSVVRSFPGSTPVQSRVFASTYLPWSTPVYVTVKQSRWGVIEDSLIAFPTHPNIFHVFPFCHNISPPSPFASSKQSDKGRITSVLYPPSFFHHNSFFKMPRKRQYDADSDGEPQYAKKSKSDSKAPKAKKELGKGQDAEGNTYFEVCSHPPCVRPLDTSRLTLRLQISAQRRVGLSNFSGKTFVNIREYYSADGEMRPGKKVRLQSTLSPAALST